MITLAAAETIAGIAQTASTVTCTIFGLEVTSTTETFKSLYQGQLPTTAATLYTAPTATSTLVKSIHVVNTSTTVTQTFRFFRGGTAGSNALTATITLPIGGWAVYSSEGWKVYTARGEVSLAIQYTVAPFATPSIVLGTTAAAGVAETTIRSDATILALSAANPTTLNFGDSPAAGSSPLASPSDHGHGLAATHGASAHTDITRYIWLDRDSMPTADSGTTGSGGTAPDSYTAWVLADAATQGFLGQFGMPSDAVASSPISATILWAPVSTLTGAVVWSIDAKAIVAGTDISAAGTTTQFTGASAARTVNIIVAAPTTQILASTSAGDLIRINVRRLGADAADTYAASLRVVGIRIDYAANQ